MAIAPLCTSRRVLTALSLVAPVVAGCGPPGGDIELAVDLRTDLRAGLDYETVRTRLRVDGEAERVTTGPGWSPGGEDARGLRVAEFRELPSGATSLRVEMLGAAGDSVASRTLELQLERSRLVTVVIREEHDEAESSAALPGPATAPEIIDEMGSDGPVDGAADLDAGSTDAAPGDAGTEDPSVMPCGHSVSDTTTLGVCRADGSPTIDGHLDEYVDSTSVRIDLPEASAVVRLSWDCERLYVGGEIFDRQLWSTHIGHDDASLWNTDSIELLLDVDHDETDLPNGDDRHIIVTATGSRWDARGDRTGWDPALELLGIEQQTRLAGTLDDFEPDEGWRVELAIPWDGLGMPSCPPVGTRLGADVALNQERRLESSGDRQWLTEDWAGLESYANPDGWRDLVLLDSSGAP